MWYLICFVLFCETFETCVLDKGLVTQEMSFHTYSPLSLMVSSNKAWLYESYFYRNYFQGLCSEKYIVFFNIVSDIVGHCTVATTSAEL